jgi:hypothetical protein
VGGIINYSAGQFVGRWRSSGARLNGIQEVRGSIPLRSTTTTSGIHQAPFRGWPSGTRFSAACCALSDVITDRVTIRMGSCPFLDG